MPSPPADLDDERIMQPDSVSIPPLFHGQPLLGPVACWRVCCPLEYSE